MKLCAMRGLLRHMLTGFHGIPCNGEALRDWIVRKHQNQKYAYGHGALILLILLASSYR